MIDNITLMPIIRKYLRDEKSLENERDILKLCLKITKLAFKTPSSLEKLQIACYCVNISLKTYLQQEILVKEERNAIRYRRKGKYTY